MGHPLFLSTHPPRPPISLSAPGMNLPPTHWTMIGGPDDNNGQIIDYLYRTYRKPVSEYLVIRWHFNHADAEDRCHDFFINVIRKRLWSRADRDRGRFRTFLFTCLRNFVISSIRRPTPDWSPEEPADPCLVFDREWAMALLRAALSSVETSWAARAKSTEFNALSRFLPGMAAAHTNGPAALSMSDEAFRKALSRLRAAVRSELRTLVSETVDPAEVDDELHYLFTVLENPGAEIR